MAKRRTFQHQKRRPPGVRREALVRAASPRPERKAPVQFGEAFVLLEDEEKNTFEYARGAWTPYAMSIAECRQESCQVKELPQKVNGKTRYEVRCPVPTAL